MDVYNYDSADLIRFAEKWAELGWAVQEQLVKVLDGDESKFSKINPAAISEASRILGDINEEITTAIEAYEMWYAGEDEDDEDFDEDFEEDDEN